MKAISDLSGLWRALCGAAGIVLGTVAGNDSDAWMVAQPRRDGLGGALRQEIHGPPAFEIDQDRPIDPPLAEGKIINAKHARRRRGGRRGAAERPEDRVPTERHAQASGHPRASFAASLPSKDTDRLGQPPGPLRMPGGKRREAFRK